MVDRILFKNRLTTLRKELGLTQYELAQKLGFSRGQIGNYEQGTREPDQSTLLKISNFFNVSTDYLLCKTDVKNYNNLNPVDKINKTIKDNGLETIAAHFEDEEFTEDDLEDIENFISYIISKKKSK